MPFRSQTHYSSRSAIRPPEGDPTHKDKAEAAGSLPFQGLCCLGGCLFQLTKGAGPAIRLIRAGTHKVQGPGKAEVGAATIVHTTGIGPWGQSRRMYDLGQNQVSQFDTSLEGRYPGLLCFHGQKGRRAITTCLGHEQSLGDHPPSPVVREQA